MSFGIQICSIQIYLNPKYACALVSIFCNNQCFSYSYQIALEKAVSCNLHDRVLCLRRCPLLFPSRGVRTRALDSEYKIYQF